MKSVTRCLLAAATLAGVCTAQGPFIHENTLGDFYPYVVHLPSNNNETLPPAVVMLGGKGSLFQENVTLGVDQVVQYGGIGWNVGNYYNGSTNPSDVQAGQQFVSIIIYQYMWYGENYSIPGIWSVLQDAQSKYTFDPARIYLSGYSMGARAAFPLIQSNDTVFAAATISAGTTYPDMSGLDQMTQTPVQLYAGAQDYEKDSQVWMTTEFVNAINQAGGQATLNVISTGTHESMQQDPYNTNMWTWLLSHKNSAVTESVADVANPTASAQYEAAYSVNRVSEAANAFSIYQAGFPDDTAVTATPGYIAAEMASAAPAWAVITGSTPAAAASSTSSPEVSGFVQNAKSSASINSILSTFSILTFVSISYLLI